MLQINDKYHSGGINLLSRDRDNQKAEKTVCFCAISIVMWTLCPSMHYSCFFTVWLMCHFCIMLFYTGTNIKLQLCLYTILKGNWWNWTMLGDISLYWFEIQFALPIIPPQRKQPWPKGDVKDIFVLKYTLNPVYCSLIIVSMPFMGIHFSHSKV